MNTQLIYTNKGNSIVRNEVTGEYISEVASTIVNAGDAVSIEAIAVSTKGTGADVIEIPRQVRGYEYRTNEIAFEFMYYLHANFKYSCVLPITMGGAGNTQNIYTTINAIDYGYLNPDIFTINHNQDYRPKNEQPTYDYAGTRLYIGSFGNNGQDPRVPQKSVTIDDADKSPGALVFNFLTTRIPIKVDYGYNSPANLTSKVTFDLHNAAFTPNKNNTQQGVDPTNFWEENLSFTTTDPAVLQATATSENSSVETIFGTAQQYYGKTASPSNPYWYPTYSNLMAVKDPWYWYWGSRLTAQAPNGVDKELGWLINNFGSTNGTNADIVMLNTLPNDGTDTSYFTGEVLVTNLKYDYKTINLLSKFIHSQKKQFIPQAKETQEEMIENRNDVFISYIPVGKYDDGDADPFNNSAKLQSKYLSQADTVRTGINVSTPTYFNSITYDNAMISLPITDVGLTDAGTLNVNGKDLNNKEVAEYFDVNIVRVVTIDGAGNEHDVIGIVLFGETIDNTIIRGGNFAVVDLTTSRDQAHCHMVLTTDLRAGGNKHQLDDVVKGFNIGAPNINLSFDTDRSRFSWRNMYWSNYIGNTQGDPANENAEQEVISINKVITDDFYTPQGYNQIPYTRYAQSGLGFYNIYVIDGDGNQVKIDRDNYNLENELKTKYKNSLLERIGFDYNDLFNTYGLPNVFFQERYQFNNLPTSFAQYFPYPLTCNPEVDTAFNQSINATDDSLPTFNLSLERNVTNINVAVQTAQILARNKPEKLATPYWLIESDIIDAMKYKIDGNPRNVMAICNRAYGSGDIVYSFAQDYKFIATKPFVISHIKTNILTSDLLPADVDDSTTIVYKIESPILPNFLSESQLMEEIEEEKKK